MIFAIISDVHSNLQALDAVLSEIESRGADAIYCLGDVVGYGADPRACLDRIRDVGATVVRGNHDEAVGLGTNIDRLPKDGQKAAIHNREVLSASDLLYLTELPYTVIKDGFTFCHATPEWPEAWQRVDSYQVAQRQFAHFENDLCFVGHTHIPAVLSNRIGVLSVRRGARFIVNVGSVGQPRDRDPRASFGIFDTTSFTYQNVRIPYNIEAAVARIRAEGLPSSLGKRLKTGM